MPIPELLLRSAERAMQDFCERRVSARARHQVRLEAVTKGSTITIVERRAPWTPAIGPEWTSHDVARLRYEPRLEKWSLFWPDRRGRWHRYDDIGPLPSIGLLLAEVDRDPTGIFWG